MKLGVALGTVAAFTAAAFALSRPWEPPRWIEWTTVAVVGTVAAIALTRSERRGLPMTLLVLVVAMAVAWGVAFLVDLATREWQ